jgi:hypothetical protein
MVVKMVKYLLPKELPQPIKERIGNTFVYSAKQMDDGRYIVETAIPWVSIEIKKIRVFNEDGSEKVVFRDIKLEVKIDDEELTLVGDNPKLLLRRLVNALEG